MLIDVLIAQTNLPPSQTLFQGYLQISSPCQVVQVSLKDCIGSFPFLHSIYERRQNIMDRELSRDVVLSKISRAGSDESKIPGMNLKKTAKRFERRQL